MALCWTNLTSTSALLCLCPPVRSALRGLGGLILLVLHLAVPCTSIYESPEKMSPKVWSSRARKRWMLSTIQPWTRQKSYHLFIITKERQMMQAKEWLTSLYYFINSQSLFGPYLWFSMSPVGLDPLRWILFFSGNTFIKCIAECRTSFSSRSIIILVCDSHNFLHNLLKLATFFLTVYHSQNTWTSLWAADFFFFKSCVWNTFLWNDLYFKHSRGFSV